MIDPTVSRILLVAAFAIYPFAILTITSSVISRCGCRQALGPGTILFTVAGLALAGWQLVSSGLGKFPSVTLLICANIVFSAGATGRLLAALAGCFRRVSADGDPGSTPSDIP